MAAPGTFVLAPVPVRLGKPVRLYNTVDAGPVATVWRVYNSAGELVSDLSFGPVLDQHLDTWNLAPGVFQVVIQVQHLDGNASEFRQRIIIIR